MNIHVIMREAQNMKNSPAIMVMQRQDGESIALSMPREKGKKIEQFLKGV